MPRKTIEPNVTPGETCSDIGAAPAESAQAAWRDRRVRLGRRKQDQEQGVLRRILEMLKTVRDQQGIAVRYVPLSKAGRILGAKRTKMMELCGTGKLESFKQGRRRMVHVDSLMAFIAKKLERGTRAASCGVVRRPKRAKKPPETTARDLQKRINNLSIE